MSARNHYITPLLYRQTMDHRGVNVLMRSVQIDSCSNLPIVKTHQKANHKVK